MKKGQVRSRRRGKSTAAPPPPEKLGRLEVHRPEARQLLGGIAERTFATLEAEGVVVASKRGRGGRPSVYDVTAIVPAYLAHATAQRPSNDRDARARKDLAQAMLNELRLAKERRDLLPRQQVILQGQSYTKAWTARLRSLPRRMVQAGLITREAEPEVTALIREVLTEIASWQTLADTLEVIDADDATSSSDDDRDDGGEDDAGENDGDDA